MADPCIPRLLLSGITSILILTSWPVFAQAPSPASGETNKIHINADNLSVDAKTTYLEFTGNVTATQEDTVITADSLKIFYDSAVQKETRITPNENSIKKIIAAGHVKIEFDNRVAVTKRAVYNTENRILVLTGKDSKVMTQGSYISGEKITVNRNNGRITFERGNKEPVTAVIQAGEKGLK